MEAPAARCMYWRRTALHQWHSPLRRRKHNISHTPQRTACVKLLWLSLATAQCMEGLASVLQSGPELGACRWGRRAACQCRAQQPPPDCWRGCLLRTGRRAEALLVPGHSALSGCWSGHPGSLQMPAGLVPSQPCIFTYFPNACKSTACTGCAYLNDGDGGVLCQHTEQQNCDSFPAAVAISCSIKCLAPAHGREGLRTMCKRWQD